MPDKFKTRSAALELMDDPNVSGELLFRNLRELDIINGISGGYAASLRSLGKLIIRRDKVYRIADLGCGGGGMMIKMASWAKRNGFRVALTGIDRNPDAIKYLRMQCRDYPEIKGLTCDYLDYLNSYAGIDIVHCSLFCHHLGNREMKGLLKILSTRVSTGFIINDLQRSRFAYYVVWLVTRMMNTSVLSKNDGPVSVLRGFTKLELYELLSGAGIRDFTITRWPVFRFLITCKPIDLKSGS